MTTPASEKYVQDIVPADQWPVLGAPELWQKRRIMFVLAQRLLKARYQHAAIGIAWVVLQPLILVIIVSVFMGFVMDRGIREDLPFAVWLFPAWTAWRIFNKIVSEGGGAVGANGPLVQRIYLPRIYFPTAVALASLVDLVFMFAGSARAADGLWHPARPGPADAAVRNRGHVHGRARLLLPVLVVFAAVHRYRHPEAADPAGLVLDVAHHLSGIPPAR